MADGLRWFLTLAELEHVSAAAADLHVTQPTLSRMLQRLERELDARLFDRKGNRIVLNDYGRVYYDHARRAQRELDAAAREIADLASPSEGVVRLSFLHSFGISLVPQLIGDFRRVAPRIGFQLDQDAAEVVTRQVVAREADLAIVSPRPTDPKIAWHTLMRQHLVLAVPADHLLARRSQVALAEAADEPFIAMHPQFGMRRILEELCAAAQFRPHIAFESSELGTVAGLVSAGLGVAVLPVEDNPQPPPGLVQVPLVGADTTRDIGLVWAADAALSRPARRFREFVTDRARAD